MIAPFHQMTTWSGPRSCRANSWHEVPCPACGSQEAEPVLQACGWQEAAARIYAVVQCQTCGVWYTNPVPDDQCSGAQQRYSPLPETAPALAALAAEVAPPPARGSWLLHFGPADVSFVERLRRRGWRVALWREHPCEVPPDWWLAEGLAVFGSLEQLAQHCPGVLTTITVADWFERQPRLAEILRLWHVLLKPSGRLVLLVPNLDGTGFRKYGSCWRGLDLPFRRVHFHASTLYPLLAQAGWRICRARTYPSLLWLQESAWRWRQSQTSKSPNWWRRLVATSTWAHIFSIWFNRLCGRGDWLVVVAQPQHAS
ncbi:hypothetical protein HRbin36_01723 [bacterium HR36]|nr:hypothetical protein HRbin36_01723 [bacterium HR36]